MIPSPKGRSGRVVRRLGLTGGRVRGKIGIGVSNLLLGFPRGRSVVALAAPIHSATLRAVRCRAPTRVGRLPGKRVVIRPPRGARLSMTLVLGIDITG